MNENDPPQKQCTGPCGCFYPATSEFWSKKKGGKFGLRAECKSCRKAYSAKWRRENPEKVKAIKAKNYAENTEARKAYNAKWRRENPEKVKAACAKYYAENTEACKVLKQKRRTTKLALPSQFTANDWKHCLTAFNHCCAVCGSRPNLWQKLAQGHWIALTDPRPDNYGTVPWNIVPLCHGIGGCNSRMNKTDGDTWVRANYPEEQAEAILDRIHDYFERVWNEYQNQNGDKS